MALTAGQRCMVTLCAAAKYSGSSPMRSSPGAPHAVGMTESTERGSGPTRYITPRRVLGVAVVVLTSTAAASSPAHAAYVRVDASGLRIVGETGESSSLDVTPSEFPSPPAHPTLDWIASLRWPWLAHAQPSLTAMLLICHRPGDRDRSPLHVFSGGAVGLSIASFVDLRHWVSISCSASGVRR